jgi:hypothetical protein
MKHKRELTIDQTEMNEAVQQWINAQRVKSNVEVTNVTECNPGVFDIDMEVGEE